MTAPAPLLDVVGLRAGFATDRGTAVAVRDVSFSVRRGRVVGIVGETGCGKSATLRSVLGLLRPPGRVTGGEVLFDGEDLLGVGAERMRRLRGERIGFVAQNPFAALNPVMRIRDQFAGVIRAHEGRRSARRTAAERARVALEAVRIHDVDRVLDGYAHQLSGGMAQRVVIALATLLDPALIVADEPTTGLDLTVQRQILDLIRGLVRRDDRAMLLVTHDLGVVAQYCDEVVVMYAGTVVEDGPVAAVLGDPAHPYTRALVDSVPRRGAALAVIGGQLPDLVEPPPGCAFAPRCPHAHAACEAQDPAARAHTSGQSFRCHLSPVVVRHGAA
ncbi:MAG: ABC transporter ATP-binding protein [Acidimicrobiia bacterium]